MAKDKMYIVPHTHYDAAVFMTREETLEKVGYNNILDVLNLLKKDDNYKFVLDLLILFYSILNTLSKFWDPFHYTRPMAKEWKKLNLGLTGR